MNSFWMYLLGWTCVRIYEHFKTFPYLKILGPLNNVLPPLVGTAFLAMGIWLLVYGFKCQWFGRREKA